MDNFLLIILLIILLYVLFKNKISNENFTVVYDGEELVEPTPPFFVNNLEDCNPDIYDIEEYILTDENGNPILDENESVSVSGYVCSIKQDICPYTVKHKKKYIDENGKEIKVDRLICAGSKNYIKVPPKLQKKNRDDMCKKINKNYVNVEQVFSKKNQIWEDVGKTKIHCIKNLELKK
jgi:hypothetical protein